MRPSRRSTVSSSQQKKHMPAVKVMSAGNRIPTGSGSIQIPRGRKHGPSQDVQDDKQKQGENHGSTMDSPFIEETAAYHEPTSSDRCDTARSSSITAKQ